MLFRILESRIVDIILIGIAVYYIFPGLFKLRQRKMNNHQSQSDVHIHQQQNKAEDKKGEYIDYEEIK